MNKNGFGLLGVIIIAALVLAVGGGTYYASKEGTKAKSNAHATTTVEVGDDNATTTANVGLNGKSSIRSLIALGRSITCTFSKTEKGNTTSGTVYIAGENMRGDFMTTGNVDSHMIKTGNDMYVWSSASGNTGAKMKVNTNASAQGQTKQAVNWDENLDYKCENWTTDSTKWNLPASINFIDLNAMLNGNVKVNLPSY